MNLQTVFKLSLSLCLTFAVLSLGETVAWGQSSTGPSIRWVNPPTDDLLPLTDGAAHKTFWSELVGQDVGYVIYLPPCYLAQPTKRFPVIYNLHGNGGNELTSLNVIELLHDQITSGMIPPVIMVLANGGRSTFYKDSFDGTFPIESIVMKELIPHIDANYRTIASGDARCIEGFSMGGRGSTRLAVKYPDQFCSLFCQAGNVPHLLQTFDSLSDQERADHLLGPERDNWQRNDVYALTKEHRATIKSRLRIQIACGTKDDGHLPSIRDWHQQLVDLDLDHTYIELQGLAHQRTEVIAELQPIWFDSHLRALSERGAFAPQTDDRNNKASPVPDGVNILCDLQYATTANGPLFLDLYRPAKITKKLPVVVFVHGGGWKGGDKKSASNQAAWLAGEGYAVASINYRLIDVSSWPSQIEDCYSAVRWIREHSARYRLDPNRIASWGTSAGGHLAALMATRPYHGAESTNSRVQACIDWFGPTDLLTMPPNLVTETRTYEEVAQSNGAKLLGAPVMTVPDLAHDASALHHVSLDDPPTLIMHGDQDPGVPLDQSVRLADTLKKVGVPVQLEIIKGAGHGGKEFQGADVRDAVRRFLKQYLN